MKKTSLALVMFYDAVIKCTLYIGMSIECCKTTFVRISPITSMGIVEISTQKNTYRI